MEAESDAQVLRAVAEGDEAALRVLYQRHATWLYVRLSRRCHDEEIVADVVQDTFVAVWRSAGRWRGEGDVGAWIWGIGLRRLVSRFRGGRAPAPMADSEVDRAGESVQSAEDAVLLGVEHGDLGPVLARMAPELRAVVQATLLDGLTTREAARLLKLPHGTVKGRVRKAKAQLRLEMAAQGRSW